MCFRVRQLAQRPVKPPGSCPVWHADAASPGKSTSRHRAEVMRPARPSRAAGTCLFFVPGRHAGRLNSAALRRADDQDVPSCADSEPEREPRPGHADATGGNQLPQGRSVRHRVVRHLAAADLSHPIPRPSLTGAPQAQQSDHHSEARGRALKSGVNLLKPPCPVRVILRRHRASVPRRQVKSAPFTPSAAATNSGPSRRTAPT